MKEAALFLKPTAGPGGSDGANDAPVYAPEWVQASNIDLRIRGVSVRRGDERERDGAEPSLRRVAATPLQINRAYYDRYADYFHWRTAGLPLNAAYEPFLRQLPSCARILDAGCGPGRNAAAFRSHGYRVTAIDASPAMVEIAKRSGIDARVMTFQQMTFNEEFDGIWAGASVLHVPHAEIPEVLNRFARALNPQGILYVSLKEGQSERIAEDGRFFSYFALNEFSDSLTGSGLFKVLNAWKRIGPDSSGTMRMWLNFLAAKSSELSLACQ